jgi:hypothetical protein
MFVKLFSITPMRSISNSEKCCLFFDLSRKILDWFQLHLTLKIYIQYGRRNLIMISFMKLNQRLIREIYNVGVINIKNHDPKVELMWCRYITKYDIRKCGPTVICLYTMSYLIFENFRKSAAFYFTVP